MNRHIVIVGNGMAGSRLVSELRARDRTLGITVFGAEAAQPYNRVLLSNVLAGVTAPGDIGLTDPAWYAANGVDARLGQEIVAIDRERKTVTCADGTVTAYGTLVLATGSAPVVPPLPGLDAEGVVAFRTLGDCEAIIRLADGARSAVVVGGGLLGLEAARGLAGRGLPVTVVHLGGHLMERQLDAEAGGVLQRTIGDLGVRTLVGARLTGARAEGGRVTGIELDDGAVLPADLVVLACGIRPETGLATAAGLTVDRGVVVDDRLRSIDDPDVHAIGECAQHQGTVYGLVAPAWEQARILADLLTGGDARYEGSRQVTRLKAAGIELAAMGETTLGDDEAEVVRFADPVRGTYKKVVIRDDRLVGAILLGETTTAGLLTQLYDRAAPVPSDRLGLLFTGLSPATPTETPVRIPDAAVVCHCNNVSKGRIRACWEEGAREVADIATMTRATTGCGGCRDTVEGILEWLGTQEVTFPTRSGRR
ncbi:FAD-dependent oxidoreductase [Actinoallomurus rhizosphaericola]|uniref:FAD-dependent oxidoreductase n=1 Tax=Actinoallomurus rhizosphaericola TaxID=2952536 RepID=UPI002093E353|nr:FAD-dependent oxidoreductase [Actinoallomurus rhizosphaericola]MCO5995163.1 FAD-dependent oxidoreductase [Actinoallomurus rhizosphaericola]